MAIYSGFSHSKWCFSIATLNYQRVNMFQQEQPIEFSENLSIQKGNHSPGPFQSFCSLEPRFDTGANAQRCANPPAARVHQASRHQPSPPLDLSFWTSDDQWRLSLLVFVAIWSDSQLDNTDKTMTRRHHLKMQHSAKHDVSRRTLVCLLIVQLWVMMGPEGQSSTITIPWTRRVRQTSNFFSNCAKRRLRVKKT